MNEDAMCECGHKVSGHFAEPYCPACAGGPCDLDFRAWLDQRLAKARADAAEKARQEADAVKDREFGNLRWMDGHAQGLKDGRAEALAPVLALADEIEAAGFRAVYVSEVRAAVASHQEGGA